VLVEGESLYAFCLMNEVIDNFEALLCLVIMI